MICRFRLVDNHRSVQKIRCYLRVPPCISADVIPPFDMPIFSRHYSHVVQFFLSFLFFNRAIVKLLLYIAQYYVIESRRVRGTFTRDHGIGRTETNRRTYAKLIGHRAARPFSRKTAAESPPESRLQFQYAPNEQQSRRDREFLHRSSHGHPQTPLRLRHPLLISRCDVTYNNPQ
jgi:hypothetical protein